MRKPVLGETLYSLNIGNAARGTTQELTPVTVSKVGRKNFTVGEGWQRKQFRLSDWSQKTNYSADYRLYESPQAWEDQKEAGDIAREISRTFQYGRYPKHLSLSALRKIRELITEG